MRRWLGCSKCSMTAWPEARYIKKSHGPCQWLDTRNVTASSSSRLAVDPLQKCLHGWSFGVPWRIHSEVRLDLDGLIEIEHRFEFALGNVLGSNRRAFKRDAEPLGGCVERHLGAIETHGEPVRGPL